MPRGRPKKIESVVVSTSATTPSNEIVISIQMGNIMMQGTGETALEALQSIPRPLKVMHKGIVTVSQGEKKKIFGFTPLRLKRLFYPSAQKFLVKSLMFGLK